MGKAAEANCGFEEGWAVEGQGRGYGELAASLQSVVYFACSQVAVFLCLVFCLLDLVSLSIVVGADAGAPVVDMSVGVYC